MCILMCFIRNIQFEANFHRYVVNVDILIYRQDFFGYIDIIDTLNGVSMPALGIASLTGCM